MNIFDAIVGAQNGGAVRQIGTQLGLPEDQTTAALGALVPALAAGFQRNVQAGGLDSLLSALAGGNHARYVDDPATLAQADAVVDGNGILAHVFGSKEVSREVAARASAQTGIGPDVLKRMLPMAAALMMGAMARQPAGPAAAAAAMPGSGGSAGSGLLNMLTASFDRNRDGSVLDDVMGMVGRVLQK